MNAKSASVLLVSGVAAALLAACGGGSYGAAGSSPSVTARASSTAPASSATRPPASTATAAAVIATEPPPTEVAPPPADTPEPPPADGDSGVEGTVTLGPTCPVERADSPCPDRPYETAFTIAGSDGRQVASVRSGPDGHFRVSLPPGTYTLTPEAKPTPPHAAPQPFTVTAGEFTHLDISFDSGIR